MIDNTDSDVLVAAQLNEWQDKVREFTANNKNKELNAILKKIGEKKTENAESYLTEAADALSVLKDQRLVYDVNSIKVVNLISEALPLSINYYTSNQLLALIGFIIIKQNPELSIATMVLDVFVQKLTICFKIKISHDTSEKSLTLFTRLIGELLQLFSKQLSGNYHIVQLITYEHLLEGTILSSIELMITTKIDEINYFEKLFSSNKDVSCDVLHKLIQRVLTNPSSLNSAMAPKIESNLCFQSLMTLSRNLSDDANLISELLFSSVRLVASPELTNENFIFIEGILVDSFLSRENYLLGVVCLEVFCQLLKRMSINQITNYISFFKDILSHSNDPLQMQRINHILNCVDAQDDLQLSVSQKIPFNEIFQTFKNNVNRENYQKLIENVKHLKVDDQEQMKKFSELIDALVAQNWNFHSALAVEILQVVKKIERVDMKMIYLMKIESAFVADLPFALKKNLLEVLISCLPHLEKSKSLSALVENSLEKLLNENYALRRVWWRENNLKYKITEEELTVPVISDDIFKKTCSATKTNYREENLKKILNYAKWLLHQPTQRGDRKVVIEIIDAFKNVLNEEKENL